MQYKVLDFGKHAKVTNNSRRSSTVRKHHKLRLKLHFRLYFYAYATGNFLRPARCDSRYIDA